MDVVEVILQNNLEKCNLSQNQRLTLYNMLKVISQEYAYSLYNDITYLYICMTSEIEPDVQKMKILQSKLSKCLLHSLVDIGTFMDKLSDASEMSPESRYKKWKNQNEDVESLKFEHKKRSELNAEWSKFLYESRETNEKAFEFVFANIQSPVTDYEFVIKSTKKVLSQKSHIFYANIQTDKLSILQKRALIHKYSEIQNIIPDATKHVMKEMINKIFHEEFVKKQNTSDFLDCRKDNSVQIKVKKNFCCVIC